jgi:hypothetical protein
MRLRCLFFAFALLFGSAAAASGMWIDVQSGLHGCAAAVGNGTTDDTAAIQCQIDYASATYNGGIVLFPPGNYLVSGGGLTVPHAVWLEGTGEASKMFVNTNSSVVTFAISWTGCPSGNHGGGMEKMNISGYIGGGTRDQRTVNIL